MYGIYGNIYHQYMVTFTINIPYMDPMGYTGDIFPGKKSWVFSGNLRNVFRARKVAGTDPTTDP
jgi:hypothetical protein